MRSLMRMLRFPRVRPVRPVVPRLRYAATEGTQDNGRPEAGEVVWAWVPYEEDATRGKDRPVLVIDATRAQVLALQLTAKDHDRDAGQEAQAGRFWVDIGAGDWDRQRRPSEVRLNRLLRLDPDAVRREGGRVSEELFAAVIAAATPYLPVD